MSDVRGRALAARRRERCVRKDPCRCVGAATEGKQRRRRSCTRGLKRGRTRLTLVQQNKERRKIWRHTRKLTHPRLARSLGKASTRDTTVASICTNCKRTCTDTQLYTYKHTNTLTSIPPTNIAVTHSFPPPSPLSLPSSLSLLTAESMPRKNSMRKKSSDHREGMGMNARAWGYVTKARAGPADERAGGLAGG